jgi:hypothetical protein
MILRLAVQIIQLVQSQSKLGWKLLKAVRPDRCHLSSKAQLTVLLVDLCGTLANESNASMVGSKASLCHCQESFV